MAASRGSGRRKTSKNVFTTKSGNVIKLNRSFGQRLRAKREAKVRKRAAYLSSLPKNRFKRILFHLQPKRMYHYWFSRDGLIMGLKITGIGIVVCFLLLVGVFAYYRKDLPPINNINDNQLGGSITYYDRTGQTVLWQDYNAVKRIQVTGNDISPYMGEATVAIEDKSFYKEGAFDIQGIVRAAYDDLLHRGGGLQGGSTITQQLVKLNEDWTQNRTIARKVKELILAVELEREYSKQDILTGYLNTAPYGNIEYGVEAASQDYFHKSAKDLTLPEAAMLAAIPQAPSVYSPYGPLYDQNALLTRQHYILDQMVKQKMITQAQDDAAKSFDILAEVQPQEAKYAGIQAPYFVLTAKQQLEEKYGAATVNTGGWKVITTLDLNLQSTAESLIAKNLPNVEAYKGDDEAMVVEDVQTGQIVASVGGVDFNNPDYGQLNFASGVNISPGSSFKPYDYSSLINDTTDTGAGSVLYDVQEPLPGYPCTNKAEPLQGGNCLEDYDFRYPGAETIRYALAGSRNVPAVKAMLTVGTNKVISTADAMMSAPDAYQCYQAGVDVNTATTQDEAPCYGSSAIGDGAYLHLDQHVNGLSTIARLGAAIPETYILKITDSSGKTIYNWTQPAATQVIRPDAAYIVDNMLSDPKASYLPTSYKFQHYDGWDIAVKTGTTNENYDGLMTAWSTKYAVASWVGYHTRTIALTPGGMEYLTEPLTKNMIEDALNSLHTTPVNWVQPSDIKVLPAFVQTAHVGLGSEEPSSSTDIFPSWYVPRNAKTSTSQTIDKVSGLVATSCTPDLAKQTVNGGNDDAFSADIFWPINQSTSSTATTTSATDNIHNCGDTMPSATVTQGATCEDPKHCDFTVTVTQGTDPLSGGSYTTTPAGTITLLDGSQTLQTVSIPTNTTSPYTYTFTAQAVNNGDQITAQVVDSVLYSGTSTAVTVNDTAQ